jgi:hypothetical protein
MPMAIRKIAPAATPATASVIGSTGFLLPAQ